VKERLYLNTPAEESARRAVLREAKGGPQLGFKERLKRAKETIDELQSLGYKPASPEEIMSKLGMSGMKPHAVIVEGNCTVKFNPSWSKKAIESPETPGFP
jgi:hypothetical protein